MYIYYCFFTIYVINVLYCTDQCVQTWYPTVKYCKASTDIVDNLVEQNGAQFGLQSKVNMAKDCTKKFCKIIRCLICQ